MPPGRSESMCGTGNLYAHRGFGAPDVQPVANHYAAYGIVVVVAAEAAVVVVVAAVVMVVTAAVTVKAPLILRKETTLSFTEIGVM